MTGPARQCQSVLTHVSRGIGKEAVTALCTSLISIAAVGHRLQALGLEVVLELQTSINRCNLARHLCDNEQSSQD